MVDAILLAGTPHSPRHLIQGKAKYFVELPRGLMGAQVINVLEKTPGIGTTYAVGNRSDLEGAIEPGKVGQIIQAKGGIYHSTLNAFTHLPGSDDPDKKVLILACDTPFLSPAGLQDFIRGASDVDLVMPYCSQEDFEGLFPGFRWPYMVFKEGGLKFGNMLLVKPNRIGHRDLLGKFFGLRKVSVSGNRLEEYLNLPKVIAAGLKLRGAEGLEIATREVYVKYIAQPLGIRSRMTDYLSIKRMAGVFSRILHCRVEVYHTRYAELCFDVDKEEPDLAYALENYDAILARIPSR